MFRILAIQRPYWPRLIRVGIFLVLLSLISACHCDPGTEPADPPTKGTLHLATIPDTLVAPWYLLGPAGWEMSSAGPDTLEGMHPGTYSCTWLEMTGWQTPEPSTQSFELEAGEAVHFLGEYEVAPPIWDTWVTIPAGQFLMGASAAEETALRNEKPQHQVTLSRDFMMQATEVTNQQYLDLAAWALEQGLATADEDGLYDNLDGSTELLMDFSAEMGGQPWCEIEFRNGGLRLRNIGFGHNPDHPVKMVTWYGAAAYCDWLNECEGLARTYDHSDWTPVGNDLYGAPGYRLPSEAEWEYACRAGTTTPFYSGEITDPFGSIEPALEGVAWYQGNSVDWTHPVGLLEPNAWGLYDMHGNVFKWVNGFEYVYGSQAIVDPVSPMTSGNRVAKGGAWTRPSHYHRVAFRRLRETLDYRGPKQGFRPVRTVAE